MPRSRRPAILWCLVSFLLCLAGAANIWRTALRAETGAVDRLHLHLAEHAAQFLTVATPAGQAGGYDPARLVAWANSLAGATFWPGQLQVVLGGTPLVPDEIGLLPLPDSVRAMVEVGLAPQFVESPEGRVALYAFRGADRRPLGWVGAWGALEPELPTPEPIAITIIALGLVSAAVGIVLIGGGPLRLAVALLLSAGAAGVLAVSLERVVGSTARAAVVARLATARRLVEMAATAPEVRQAELPALVPGLEVEAVRGDRGAAEPVEWSDSVATVVAATPRTQGSLILRLRAPAAGFERLPEELAVAAWPFAAGLLGLGVAGFLARRDGARRWSLGRQQAIS
jgi:hypothetical protein